MINRLPLRLRRPTTHEALLGVILFASAFPFRFHVTSGQTASVFDFVLFVVATLFAFSRPWKDGLQLPKPFLALGGVSLALGLLSFFWTQSADSTLVFVVSTGEGIITFMMIVLLLRGQSERFIIYTICTWIALFAIGSALMYAHVPGFLPTGLNKTGGDYISFFTRFSHPLIGRSNNIATLLVVVLPALSVWAMIRRNKLSGGFAIGTIVLLIATGSRGALIGLIMAYIAWVFIDARARLLGRRFGIWIAGVLILLACTVGIYEPWRNFVLERAFGARNLNARTDLLSVAWTSIGNHLWLGVGGGNGADVHNTFVQQVVYFGIVGGCLAAAAFVWTIAFWFFPKRRPQSRWLYIAGGVGVAAQALSFLFEASFEGNLLRPLIWMSWALLLALAEAGSKRQNDGVLDRRASGILPIGSL